MGQKSHWGVTKVLSKIQLGTRALFVRTGEVETPFPRRFLQFLGAEAEAWSLQPSNNNVLWKCVEFLRLSKRSLPWHLSSACWNAVLKKTFVTAMGKIQLCDGQVHGNDVDKIGWSVFTCLLSLGWLISHGRVRNRPNPGLVCKCYALSEHAPPRAKLISPQLTCTSHEQRQWQPNQ